MLLIEAEQCAEALFSLAQHKSYVLERIDGYKICLIVVGCEEYTGFTEIFLYDLIFKKVLFHDLYVPNENVVDVLTGYLI